MSKFILRLTKSVVGLNYTYTAAGIILMNFVGSQIRQEIVNVYFYSLL